MNEQQNSAAAAAAPRCVCGDLLTEHNRGKDAPSCRKCGCFDFRMTPLRIVLTPPELRVGKCWV
jgi:hypothetical protein